MDFDIDIFGSTAVYILTEENVLDLCSNLGLRIVLVVLKVAKTGPLQTCMLILLSNRKMAPPLTYTK